MTTDYVIEINSKNLTTYQKYTESHIERKELTLTNGGKSWP